MIAMWGAKSFRTMGKLLGPFSGRSLRGSQNIRMAKQLKQIDGHIAQINAPRFAEDRKMWVMMVKENGKWQAVTSRNEEKIKSYHQLLESKQPGSHICPHQWVAHDDEVILLLSIQGINLISPLV